MSEGPTGPCADAPAPLSPGLAEAGGEYGCGTVGSGQRERQGTGSLGRSLNDPWVAKGRDPWARRFNRMNIGYWFLCERSMFPFKHFVCGNVDVQI